jgi:hypothetical protein
MVINPAKIPIKRGTNNSGKILEKVTPDAKNTTVPKNVAGTIAAFSMTMLICKVFLLLQY